MVPKWRVSCFVRRGRLLYIRKITSFSESSDVVDRFPVALLVACIACVIEESTRIWLFKQYARGPAAAVIKSCLVLSNSVNFGHEGALHTDSKVVKLLLNRYLTDDNIENLDDEVQGPTQEI